MGVDEGIPPRSSQRPLVPSHGIRLAYLEQVEASAKELLYPLTVTEPDGTPRIVPSYEALTCADVCEQIVLPTTAEAGGGSVCEKLHQEGRTSDGRPLVSAASRLVSYAWSYLFADLLSVLRAVPGISEQWLWLDMFVINQHATNYPLPDDASAGAAAQAQSGDGASSGGGSAGGGSAGGGGMRLDAAWLLAFQEVVRSIGHTIVVLDSWTLPVPPTRAWCCLEGFVSASVSAKLEIALPELQRVQLREALLDGHFDEVVGSLCPVGSDLY